MFTEVFTEIEVEELKKYETEALIEYLQKKMKPLRLDEDDLSIIRKERFTGYDFLALKRRVYGLWYERRTGKRHKLH